MTTITELQNVKPGILVQLFVEDTTKYRVVSHGYDKFERAYITVLFHLNTGDYIVEVTSLFRQVKIC